MKGKWNVILAKQDSYMFYYILLSNFFCLLMLYKVFFLWNEKKWQIW